MRLGLIFLGIVLLADPVVLTGKTRSKVNKVKDAANFFDKSALAQANQEIRDIYRDYGVRVKLETVLSAPSSVGEEVPVQFNENPAFSKWLNARMETSSFDALYILITKNPPHIVVSQGKKVKREASFSLTSQKFLMTLFFERLSQKQANVGLLEGLAYVRNTLSNQIRGTRIPTFKPPVADPKPKASSNLSSDLFNWIGVLIVAAFGIWLAIRIFRSIEGTKVDKSPKEAESQA